VEGGGGVMTESGSRVVWAGWETRSVRTCRRCHAGSESEPELRGIVCNYVLRTEDAIRAGSNK
jgi:hypothetical protein